MKKTRILISIIWMIITITVLSQDNPQKIAIIKADDLKKKTKNWERFFAVSKDKGVKVSAGIVCITLIEAPKDYLDWLRELNASGQVEFWNHGWTHKHWKNDKGDDIWEFRGSEYDIQKQHYTDSQKIMTLIFGSPPIAFGPPFNEIDSNTVRILNEDNQMRIFFGRKKRVGNKILAPLILRGEHDGTGKPNFEKFKADYPNYRNVAFTAIQFHPNGFTDEHFSEYAKIIDFLLSEGWIFMLPNMLPKEYLAMQERKNSPSSMDNNANIKPDR